MPFTPFGLQQFASWNPADDGFLGMNSDPAGASGGGLVTAGNLMMNRLPVRVPTVITNVWYAVTAAGAGASTGSFVGLYSPAGVLLSGSTDQGATFTGTTGWKSGALTTPQALAGGPTPASWPFVGVLCNLATTQVTLLRQLTNGNVNAPQAPAIVPATLRWGIFAAVGTALPASLTMANMAASGFSLVIGWN